MKTKDLEDKVRHYADKAKFFRRLAFVYRYGREEDIYNLINEIDKLEGKREIAAKGVYKRLNEIVGKYFFPLREQLKYLGNKDVVGFEELRKIKND